MLRDDITTAMKQALREKEQKTLDTTRMILAKIKDADIAARAKGNSDGIEDAAVMALLQGMVKQRRESITLYEKGNRADLADGEKAEIAVIERFLPQQMSEDELRAVVNKIKEQVGAQSIKDMGKIMGVLKKDYAGKVDMSLAGKVAKDCLTN